ncbi:hypothetical protein [Falsarthrobacter nasiphocae]|uniref:Uncharacterized protein n=1 Tax=Falsarthrobacter nasiphocae TaxID=189863 RepID=A0AAE3YFX2_9MICC|nr:hypothetical protein [Falsarthrobacter nasiphocae]MDR6891193.1 hypothetical protein [Falsarthrobacter nasiphocae]
MTRGDNSPWAISARDPRERPEITYRDSFSTSAPRGKSVKVTVYPGGIKARGAGAFSGGVAWGELVDVTFYPEWVFPRARAAVEREIRPYVIQDAEMVYALDRLLFYPIVYGGGPFVRLATYARAFLFGCDDPERFLKALTVYRPDLVREDGNRPRDSQD